MCEPTFWIGMAIGAASSAMQGGDFGDIVLGGVIGGVGGYIGGGMGGFVSGGEVFAGSLAQGTFALAPGIAAAAQGGFLASTVGSMAMGTGMFAQPDYSQFGYGAQPYEPQGFSSQHATVTGSGGRQAAAVLAQEIKRSRTLRQRQQEETTAYSVAGELASTGLQIA